MQIDPGSRSGDTPRYIYALRFRDLTRNEKEVKPTWREVKKYPRTTDEIENGANMLCGADILDETLDEVLNCLLNKFVRIQHSVCYRLQGNNVRFLKQLLDRWASLWFTAADERSSPIEALLSCVRFEFWCLPLSEFTPYICCPVFHKYGYREISFDSHRSAALCCLAARKIPRSGNSSKLPLGLRFFIEAHQEFQFLFG